jgi:S1-C subfamily serine protease
MLSSRRALVGLALILAWAPHLAGQTVGEVFRQVSHAVVIVHTTQTQYPLLTTDAPVSVPGTGSGVLISPTEILTAAHVVQAANKVRVEFPSGQEIGATVVASQPDNDVALLRLDEPAQVSPVPMGNSDEAVIGDQVLVIGAPLGEGHTLTVGHIGAHRTRRGLFGGISEVDFLQTDAAINPGNSGGPMFNLAGEVIGIVSHILTLSGGSMGLGFAVSANDAQTILSEEASVWTGLDSTPIAGGLAALLNVPPPGGGILVEGVAIGSMAESLGLRPSTIPISILDREILIGGDIILSVQGIPVGAQLEGMEPIRRAMAALQAGETLTVTVLREGRQMELSTRRR